jgi:hypothetical protein
MRKSDSDFGCPGTPAAFKVPLAPPIVMWKRMRQPLCFFCHLVFRHLADSASLAAYSVFCPAYSGEDACVASQPGQPGVEPAGARFGPAIKEVIAVEGAAGSGTASAKNARDGSSRQLPARSAEAEPGAAAPAGEPEPGTGQRGVAAAGRLPKAAGEESQDKPFVSGDDDGDLPAAQGPGAAAQFWRRRRGSWRRRCTTRGWRLTVSLLVSSTGLTPARSPRGWLPMRR